MPGAARSRVSRECPVSANAAIRASRIRLVPSSGGISKRGFTFVRPRLPFPVHGECPVKTFPPYSLMYSWLTSPSAILRVPRMG